jgi:hypothetical protein
MRLPDGSGERVVAHRTLLADGFQLASDDGVDVRRFVGHSFEILPRDESRGAPDVIGRIRPVGWLERVAFAAVGAPGGPPLGVPGSTSVADPWGRRAALS